MTYDQYWYGDPLMVRAYFQAEKIRQERADSEAWLYGLYVAKAIDSTIGNAFRKEGTAEYPAFPLSTKKEIVDKYNEEQEALAAEAYMMQMVAAGANWGEEVS